MELKFRLAALSRILLVGSIETESVIDREFDTVEKALTTSTSYTEISDALKVLGVLAPKFHGAVVPLLAGLVRRVQAGGMPREDSQTSRILGAEQAASLLILEAIEVAQTIQYVRTPEVFGLFLEVSAFPEVDLKATAERAMESLAEFNLDIFFGKHGQGATPQAQIVGYLAELDDGKLLAHFAPVLKALGAVLSPSMQGTSWSFDQVTIRRGAIQAAYGVAEVRDAALALLKRIYFLSNCDSNRRAVLSTMNAATRRERAQEDKTTEEMFERNAAVVLGFLRGLVSTESLPLVQAIEHDAYWNYFHATSPSIESAALEIRDAIAQHSEYQIYKALIGFEGIFGEWEELKNDESAWDYSDTHRLEKASGFVRDIGESNRVEWLNRILQFSRTKSNDLATFPVFYAFLEMIGKERPELAMELLSDHELAICPFLIPIIRGLYDSKCAESLKALVDRWIAEGKHLSAIAKSLHDGEGSSVRLLERILVRASELSDAGSILNAMEVATTLRIGNSTASKLFMDGFRRLSATGNAGAMVNLWHCRKLRVLIEELSLIEREELLSGLESLNKITYQAEEILFHIAKPSPNLVIDYLLKRLSRDRELRRAASGDQYEAIPFQFHKLKEVLSPKADLVVAGLRSEFTSDDSGLFAYRGARLARGLFPGFDEPLKDELLTLVAGAKQQDIAFAVQVLQSFDGQPAVLEVVKEIIKAVPERSETWNGLAAAIENTGAVWGTHGIAEALAGKKRSIALWLHDENARVRAFSEWMTLHLDRVIALEKQRAEEEIALRRFQYGESTDRE